MPTSQNYVLSDHLLVERDLADPDCLLLRNLYQDTDLEVGPEMWDLLEHYQQPRPLGDAELLQAAAQARVLVPADEPVPVSPFLAELEDAVDDFIRTHLKTDQAGLEKAFPPATSPAPADQRASLRRKLEAVSKVWLGYLTRLRMHAEQAELDEEEPAGPIVEGVGEGAWLYATPEIAVLTLFDHLCRLLDDVVASKPSGVSVDFLKRSADRPAVKEHLHQQPCTPATTLRRVERIVAQCPPPARVLILGDDDLVSLALDLHGGYDIDVLELDEDLVAFLTVAAPRVRILKKDLSEGLDEDFRGCYDVVVTDPPYNREGMRFFLRCCAAALKPVAGSRLFLNTCRILLEDLDDVHRTAHDYGLVCDTVLPGFSQYPIFEQFRLWGFELFNALGLPARLGGTILDQPYLWADLLEYAPQLSTDEPLLEGMDLVETRATEYQTIRLYRDGDNLCLTNNEGIQFHSGDAGANHEVLTCLPLMLTEKAEQVLILGGGDGLAAREALRFPEVQRVVVVDIDQGMLDLAANQPDLERLTEGALKDSRVETHAADAFHWLENTDQRFDLIINDIDLIRTPQQESVRPERLRKFVEAQVARLRPGGGVSLYCPVDPDGARFFDCPQSQVIGQLEGLLGPLFGAAVRTPLHTPYVGAHVYLCGLTGRPEIRRDCPSGTVQVGRSLVELSLQRSRTAPPRRPTTEDLLEWEHDEAGELTLCRREGDECVFVDGAFDLCRSTAGSIFEMAVSLPLQLTREAGSCLLLGSQAERSAEVALETAQVARIVVFDPYSCQQHGDERVDRIAAHELQAVAGPFDLVVARLQPTDPPAAVAELAAQKLADGGLLCLYCLVNDARDEARLTDGVAGWKNQLSMRITDESGGWLFVYASRDSAPLCRVREGQSGVYLKPWLVRELLCRQLT